MCQRKGGAVGAGRRQGGVCNPNQREAALYGLIGNKAQALEETSESCARLGKRIYVFCKSTI